LPFEQTIAEYFISDRALIIDYFERKGWKHKTTLSSCSVKMENKDGEIITIFPVIDLVENIKMKGLFYKENRIQADYILCVDSSYDTGYTFLFACNINNTRKLKSS